MVRDDYAWMARDATESERLDVQHHLIVKTMGYLLHPKIPIPSNARIADIATGTGIILTELAKTMPRTCQFDGFDITDAQFSSDLPENVKLHVADVKQPLSSGFHGQFDVVNIRYLNAGMKPEDWAVVTKNASALLKPRGWLQWIEGDFSQIRFWYQMDPQKQSSGALQEFNDLMSKDLEPFSYFKYELPRAFSSEGLKHITQDVTSTDRLPETRMAWAPISMGPITSFLMYLQQTGKVQVSPEYCYELRDKILDEAASGAFYTRFDIHTILGQRLD